MYSTLQQKARTLGSLKFAKYFQVVLAHYPYTTINTRWPRDFLNVDLTSFSSSHQSKSTSIAPSFKMQDARRPQASKNKFVIVQDIDHGYLRVALGCATPLDVIHHDKPQTPSSETCLQSCSSGVNCGH
jgi:hypothetical protein